MQDHVNKILNLFQWIMQKNFKKSREETIEVMLMLAVGHVFGVYTPNQLSEILGIPKSKLYEEVKNWSIYQWRRMLILVGCEFALRELKEVREKSESTKSRKRITLSVDDTVLQRCGKILSLTYSWYSGRVKKIVRGQNILGIVIRIGKVVIPLALRPVGKQGCANTSKPEIFKDMIEEVEEFFRKEGIDITEYPITFDSWYGSMELVTLLQNIGFTQILIHGKNNLVFTIKGVKKPLSEHKKEIELREGEWGCGDIPTARVKAKNPTFGELILLFFRQAGQCRVVMVFGRKLRACEILNIWHQHNGIEQFWKNLKSILHLQRMSLRGREGCYAVIAIKLLAYLIMLYLSKKFHFSLYRLQIEARRYLNFRTIASEHFHVARRLTPR